MTVLLLLLLALHQPLPLYARVVVYETDHGQDWETDGGTFPTLAACEAGLAEDVADINRIQEVDYGVCLAKGWAA